MFDELLNNYETQLELLEEIEFRKFEELEAGCFEELMDFDSSGVIPAEADFIVEIIETGFASLNEQGFTKLSLRATL